MSDASLMRYMAIDLGSKRIGVAITDESGLSVQPLMTLERRRIPREDLRSISRLARKYGVTAFVVGLPLHMSGEESPKSTKARAFAAELSTLSGHPVHMWDERLTSEEAHQILYQAGRKRREHKVVVDQVAAVLILESFLNAQRRV